jgi:HK97 family phage portal protein
MGIINRIGRFFGFSGLKRKDGVQHSAPAGYQHASAATVSFDSAMTVSAFWASVRLLAETISSLPINAYTIDGTTREKTTDNELWRILNFQPNRYQTRVEFFETTILNLVTDGNAYCAVQRNNRGEVVQLIPLMSAQMKVVLMDDGSIVYQYNDENDNLRVYAQESIWHLKLFGNGVIGLSPLQYARQSLGIAIATDNRVSVLAATGGKTSGVLTVDQVLSDQQREAVKRNFSGLTQGSQDGLFVLEANMKYQQTSLSPADMQLLENRRFQTEDIARFMGVPSVLINDTSGTTAWGSGIAQIMDGFYKLTIRPYLERIEASILKNLMPRQQWGKVEFEFDFDALLRADQETRFAGYQKGINSGVITPNEARSKEGLKPEAGGDTIYLNGSLQPAEQAATETET